MVSAEVMHSKCDDNCVYICVCVCKWDPHLLYFTPYRAIARIQCKHCAVVKLELLAGEFYFYYFVHLNSIMDLKIYNSFAILKRLNLV